MIGLLTAALLDAARFERDRRAESYPAKIVGAAPDAIEAMTIDYQCWVAIAEWIETDRFYSFAGGAEPGRADAPIISWPQLVDAAALALKVVTGEDEESQVRKARLTAIHAKLARMKAHVDFLNAALRAPRQEIAA